jgi:hypothetical protein
MSFIRVGGRLVFRLSTLSVPISALLLFAGCATISSWFEDESKYYTVNPKFSVNIAEVDKEWPRDFDRLTPLEQEAYEKHGRPELIHVWWDRRESVVTESQVMEYQTAQKGSLKPLKISWLYPESDVEILFDARTELTENKIDDKLKTIIEVGDPDRIKYGKRLGKRSEQWVYYRQGRMYEFLDNILVNVDENSFSPIPNYRR